MTDWVDRIGHRHRLHRLRAGERLRTLVRETTVETSHLIQGVFVSEVDAFPTEISSMPGIYRHTLDSVVEHVAALQELGVRHIILFGIPADKDARGSQADDESGIVQRALRALRQTALDVTLVADACLCEYTDHGHCGALHANATITIDHEQTLERLASLAVSLAEAGADIIAPSGMIDGTVATVRDALDRNNFGDIPIMMYSAKYASAWYGPFREAADGAPQFGDRSAYQMDPANGREALRETLLDIDEGADIVMVKPALSYLDIIRRLREATTVPIAAYNVSGEYAMVKAAAARGWIDERRIVEETLLSMRRAGADMILTYHAEQFARWRREG